MLFIESLNAFLWRFPLPIWILFIGIVLTYFLRGIQFTKLFPSFSLIFQKEPTHAKGEISNFQSLMTALAGMIGIGSITGVSTAIAFGGIGSIFWMWVMAFFAMAIKYAESMLGFLYREHRNASFVGGPMYYLKKGVKSKFLALFFSIACLGACLSTGNLVQANAIGEAVQTFAPLPLWLIGLFLSLLTAIALFGGIKSIGKICGYFVPFMAIFYLLGTLWVIWTHLPQLPAAIISIVKCAFTGQAAVGGFTGSTFLLGLQFGVSRGIFSSEAGLGTGSIASAAAKETVPEKQALIAMSSVFFTSIFSKRKN